MSDDRQARIAALVSFLRKHNGECSVRIYEHGQQVLELTFTTSLPAGLDDECKIACYQLLKEVARRMTGDEVVAELERRCRAELIPRTWSDNWIKSRLSDMHDAGILDNDSKSKPKGYGIPH